VPQVLLKLISSMATAELLAELVTTYQRSTGISVVAEAAGGVAVLQRIQAGEAADVVVLAGNVIDKLIVEGRLLVGTRLDLVRSGIAVAVRAGAPKPSIADEAAVRQAVLNAKTLSFSTGPSGVYLEKLFERWGILEQIRSRIVVPPPGIPVGSFVAAGSAELGFQQLSELQSLAGIEILGALPPAIPPIRKPRAPCCSSSLRRLSRRSSYASEWRARKSPQALQARVDAIAHRQLQLRFD